MQIAIIGLDLAKNVFQVHGIEDSGQAVLKRKLSRSEVLPFIAFLPTGPLGRHRWVFGRRLGVGLRPELVQAFLIAARWGSSRLSVARIESEGGSICSRRAWSFAAVRSWREEFASKRQLCTTTPTATLHSSMVAMSQKSLELDVLRL
jgi:hypothetical protein